MPAHLPIRRVLFSCALLLGRPAAAQPQPAETPSAEASPEVGNVQRTEEARRLYEEGLADFEARRYDEAIAKFEASYQRTPAPGMLYNLAQAYRLKGDCVTALRLYREYLATNPTGKARERTEERIAELEPCPEAPASPASAPPSPEPGATAGPQTTSTPSVQQAPPQKTAPPELRPIPAAPPEKKSKLVPALVGFGSAAVLLSLGAYFGVRSSSASADVSAAFERRSTWNRDLAEAEEQGPRDEMFAIASLASGILATGVTVWVLTWD